MSSFVGVRYEHLCPKGQRDQTLVDHALSDLRRITARLEAAEDHYYSAIDRYTHELDQARTRLHNQRAQLATHVAHCTHGCQRDTRGPAFANDNQTGMWDRAPSHAKPPLPTTSVLAAMLADGQTVQGLGIVYHRNPETIAGRLRDAGYSAITGKPLHRAPNNQQANDRPPVFEFPDWMNDALCAQTDPEAFFPEKGGSTREAKAVCNRCPVATECLTYALETGERFGIFGGHSERDRRKLTKTQGTTGEVA